MDEVLKIALMETPEARLLKPAPFGAKAPIPMELPKNKPENLFRNNGKEKRTYAQCAEREASDLGGSSAQFPKIPLPHVVMSGRSNVGKSSLVNCLLNRKNFAPYQRHPRKNGHHNF
jgi:ribosome biogenesis GTPase A